MTLEMVRFGLLDHLFFVAIKAEKYQVILIFT